MGSSTVHKSSDVYILAVGDIAFQYPENLWTLHWDYLKIIVLSAFYALNFLVNQSM